MLLKKKGGIMKKSITLIFWLVFILPIYCFSSSSIRASSDSIKQLSPAQNSLKTLLLKYGYKEVPIRFSNDKNYLLIDITLGSEKISKPFILDTGATQNSIDQSLQDKYKFKRQGKNQTSGGVGGGYFSTYEVIIPKMRIGDYVAYNQLMTIQHYKHIKVDEKHIAGMIGLGFLRKNHVILDIENHRMFLKVRNDKSKVTQQILENILSLKKYKLIHLKRSSSGHQTLLVKINDEKPAQFMLDSGVPPSVFLDYKYATDIFGEIKGKPSIGKGSSNAITKIYTSRINKLSIDTINSGPQSVIITTGLEFAKIGIPLIGVIGLNWMRSHQAIIDTSDDLLFAK